MMPGSSCVYLVSPRPVVYFFFSDAESYRRQQERDRARVSG